MKTNIVSFHHLTSLGLRGSESTITGELTNIIVTKPFYFIKQHNYESQVFAITSQCKWRSIALYNNADPLVVLAGRAK